MDITIMEIMERYVSMSVLLGNVMQMNNYFIGPGILAMLLSFFFFIYIKPLIILSQEFSLRKMTPLFHLITETMNGITQIGILNRRLEFLRNFSQQIDIFTRIKLAFSFHGRVLAVVINYIMITLLMIAMLIGIYNLTPENSSMYGVQIFFLLQVSEYLMHALRMLIDMESYLVNA